LRIGDDLREGDLPVGRARVGRGLRLLRDVPRRRPRARQSGLRGAGHRLAVLVGAGTLGAAEDDVRGAVAEAGGGGRGRGGDQGGEAAAESTLTGLLVHDAYLSDSSCLAVSGLTPMGPVDSTGW